MKTILFLTRLDPTNINSWSGTNFFMLKALKKNFKVITVGPLSNRIRALYIFKRFVLSFFNIKFDIDRPISVAKDFATQIENKISKYDYDAVISSDTYLLSFLKVNKPIFVFTDVCFSTYYNHYFKNIRVSRETILNGDFCEKLALLKSKKIILTSKWAINESSKYYKINKSKYEYLPLGANILKIPKKKYLVNKIKKKNLNVCNLVSIGVHWNRKGMQKAISLTQKMNQLGQRTNLFIIGAQPPEHVVLPKNIKLTKFLNKNRNINELNKILYKSHFHVLFSKKEAFGVVNCEASAYGLFTITHDIGGIGGAIFNNKNGFRFSKNNSIEHISKYLINIFNNKKNFIRKSIGSRNVYDEKLNWNVIGKKLESIIIKNIK
jgi:glycosyltransferase involved in cell wall biosynthesis